MSDRVLSRLAVALALVYLATSVIAIVLSWQIVPRTNAIGLLVGLSGYTIVGTVLATRRPRNPIGWLFMGASLAGAALKLTESLAIYGLVNAPGSIPFAPLAGWLVAWFGSALSMLLILPLFVFPSGRLPSPRWRPVVLGIGVFFLVITVIVAFGEPSPGRPQYPEVMNPFLVPALFPIARAVEAAGGFYTVVLGLALAMASLVARYRAAPVAERQRLKWIVFGAVITVALFVAPSIVPSLLEVTAVVALNVLPTAVAIAILRYGLYDIDHLINRTLVYGGTSGLIAGLFFAGIVALQPLLRPLTSGSELAVAVSTLVAFALFQPIRGRVQDAVDRRFNQSHYDAAQTLDAFAEDLRDEVDLDDLRADLIGAVRQTMSPAHASLWLRERGR
jgi:hypothetical protein